MPLDPRVESLTGRYLSRLARLPGEFLAWEQVRGMLADPAGGGDGRLGRLVELNILSTLDGETVAHSAEYRMSPLLRRYVRSRLRPQPPAMPRHIAISLGRVPCQNPSRSG